VLLDSCHALSPHSSHITSFNDTLPYSALSNVAMACSALSHTCTPMLLLYSTLSSFTLPYPAMVYAALFSTLLFSSLLYSTPLFAINHPSLLPHRGRCRESIHPMGADAISLHTRILVLPPPRSVLSMQGDVREGGEALPEGP
jgi:hypothetical protein